MYRRALIILSIVANLAVISSAATITINPDNGQRSFSGWGTAICWWGNIVGGYSEKNRDSIVSLVFDTANGLGLTIIRYNIGGGDAPSHNHMGAGKEMEGFLDGAGKSWSWDRDKNQRTIVEAAVKKINPDHFIAEAFSNSPPYWMTVSGCASGASNSGQNLKSDSYTLFADYLTGVVKQFRDEWGVTFSTLEPLNEPMGDWWSVNGGQEGCSFSRENQAKIISEVHKQLTAKDLVTKIAASDEAGYDDAVATYNAFNAETRSLISQINTHGYSGSKRSELRKLADRDGKKLWASEIDGSGAPQPFDKWKHDHNDIAPALDIAGRIIRDIRDLQPDGWIFWQVVESEQAQISLDKNWGCIHADFTGGEKWYIPKKFYGLRQFTRFIRPHSTMINCSDNESVAFLSADRNHIIFVRRNTAASASSVTCTLPSGTAPDTAIRVWRTSNNENFAQIDDIQMKSSSFTASLKAQSITTFVIPVHAATAAISPYVLSRRQSLFNAVAAPDGNLMVTNRHSSPATLEAFSLRGEHLAKTVLVPGTSFFAAPYHDGIVTLRFAASDGTIIYKSIIVTGK